MAKENRDLEQCATSFSCRDFYWQKVALSELTWLAFRLSRRLHGRDRFSSLGFVSLEMKLFLLVHSPCGNFLLELFDAFLGLCHTHAVSRLKP